MSKQWSRQFSNANSSSSRYVPTEILAPFTTGSEPTTQIEMSLSCRNLINADILSKSDPYCLVQMKGSGQDKFYEIGRTETIQDNLSPQWVFINIIDNFESKLLKKKILGSKICHQLQL